VAPSFHNTYMALIIIVIKAYIIWK